MAGALLRLLPAGWGAGSGSSRRCAGRGEAGGPEQWVAEGGTSWMPLQPLTGSASRPSSPCVCHGACVWLPFGLALWQVTCILGRVWGAFPPRRPVLPPCHSLSDAVWSTCRPPAPGPGRPASGKTRGLLCWRQHPTPPGGGGPPGRKGTPAALRRPSGKTQTSGRGGGGGASNVGGGGEAAEAQAPGPIAAGVWALLSRLGGRVLCCTPTCQAVPLTAASFSMSFLAVAEYPCHK